MPGEYALIAALAATLPGLAAWLAGRRFGLSGLLAALAVVAVIAVSGWIVTREVLTGDLQIRRAGMIFFVIVPGLVSLILGAVFGFWEANRRRPH